MTTLLDCVEIPARGVPRGSVIWLHGLGADGHDFEPIVPELGRPDLRFIFPNAPSMPITINGGFVMPAWYDIRTMKAGPGRDNEEDIRVSEGRIQDLIRREVKRGIAPQDIVLAGFSQGGAMALHTGIRYPYRLKGIMVLSAYLVVEQQIDKETHPANRQTPMLFCHGSMDPMVPMQRGRSAFERMDSGERECSWQQYPMGHELCREEVGVIAQWLGELYG